MSIPLMDVSYIRFMLHGETDQILLSKKRPPSLTLDVPSPKELEELLGLMVARGTCKVRLAGDDPVLREDLPELVALVARLDGVVEVALTTRGIGMAGRVKDLSAAGLRSVNFHLDTLKPDRYAALNGVDEFESVWTAMQESLAAGLRVKVNCVLQEQFNADEIDSFVALTADQPIDVRFVEWNASIDRVAPPEHFVPTWEAIGAIKSPLRQRDPDPFGGPAVRYEIPGHLGGIGFIANLTEHLCADCDRIGLTDLGEISSCVFGRGLSLLRLLRSPGSVASADAFIDRVLKRKASLASKLSGWEAPAPVEQTDAPQPSAAT